MTVLRRMPATGPGHPARPARPRRRVLLAGTVPVLPVLIPVLAGCATGAATLSCLAGETRALPGALDESSGAAWSGRDGGVFWTVNDGGQGDLFAVDTTGALLARIETEGSRLRDVEDLAGAPCPPGYCLYLADTGDNDERRDQVALHRLAEPDLDDDQVERTAFPMRFPDGPRDVEALIVLPGERVFLVTKGRAHPPTVYRYPGPLTADSVRTLEALSVIGRGPSTFMGRITGASHVPGTADQVLIRSYESLTLYRLSDAGLESLPGSRLSLTSLEEAQGEAVAADGSGRVLLTSEAGPLAARGTFRILRCQIGEDGPSAS
ncbi:MAG: hypothetical protein RQ751_01230 [Longimicrobiales bacterium]|nr:hypothetical protein [Longimicrobiales bacterium]